MATKTISLEIEAYEKLRRAKRSDRESFSSVVRRARWDDTPPTAGDKRAKVLPFLDHLAGVAGLG